MYKIVPDGNINMEVVRRDVFGAGLSGGWEGNMSTRI
jgi:hypothetical protein